MMAQRTFSEWFSTFRQSINGYGYYIDFPKVYDKAARLKPEIYLLNSLVGSPDVEADFGALLDRYPDCVRAIPILLAVREWEIYCQDENGAVRYRFDRNAHGVAEYRYFMRETGLFDMLQRHIVSNLYDYVTGVEAGLDSNGRKNRGGHQMENLVENYLKKYGVEYHKEMYLTEIESRWGLNLSAISAAGTSTKRFDFVVKTPSRVFGIETNFYASGGSKLNETARSYKMIAEEAKTIPGFRFVWITDGGGWQSARRNLEETFQALDDMYNITDMESGVFETLFRA